MRERERVEEEERSRNDKGRAGHRWRRCRRRLRGEQSTFFSFLCRLWALSLATEPICSSFAKSPRTGIVLGDSEKEIVCAHSAERREREKRRWRARASAISSLFLFQCFYLELLRRQPVELRIHRGDDGRRRGLDAGARYGRRQRGEREEEAEEEGEAGWRLHFFFVAEQSEEPRSPRPLAPPHSFPFFFFRVRLHTFDPLVRLSLHPLPLSPSALASTGRISTRSRRKREVRATPTR